MPTFSDYIHINERSNYFPIISSTSCQKQMTNHRLDLQSAYTVWPTIKKPKFIEISMIDRGENNEEILTFDKVYPQNI